MMTQSRSTAPVRMWYAICTYYLAIELESSIITCTQNLDCVSLPTLGSEDLSDADRAILDELQEGDRTKGYIVDMTGYHRNTVGHRLEVLEVAGCIECIHRGTALYRLDRDPRESND